MIFNYIYLILILGMLVILFCGIKFTSSNIPSKIKLLSLTVFFLLLGRYITLVAFLFTNNIKCLYLFKPIYFINMLCIPCAAVVTIFIFMRNDKIKFSTMSIVCGVFLGMYVYMILSCGISISVSMDYGYVMHLKECFYPKLIYLLFNVVFLLLGVKILYNSGSNKRGMNFIILASLLSICEIIIEFLGMNFLPQNIPSEIAWTAILVYSIKKLKR